MADVDAKSSTTVVLASTAGLTSSSIPTDKWLTHLPVFAKCNHFNGNNLFVWERDGSFSCVVKTQRRWSNKIYKTELTKIRYKNQVLCKYQVDPQRAGLTLITELTWSNLGLKGVLNKRK